MADFTRSPQDTQAMGKQPKTDKQQQRTFTHAIFIFFFCFTAHFRIAGD